MMIYNERLYFVLDKHKLEIVLKEFLYKKKRKRKGKVSEKLLFRGNNKAQNECENENIRMESSY